MTWFAAKFAGGLAGDQAMTTRLEDLARLAGVSISTASRALNDSPAVNDRTKQPIWKLAREHDYPFRRYMPAGPIGAPGHHRPGDAASAGAGRAAERSLLPGTAGRGRRGGARAGLRPGHEPRLAGQSFDDLSAAMTTSRADGVIFLGQSTLHSRLQPDGRDRRPVRGLGRRTGRIRTTARSGPTTSPAVAARRCIWRVWGESGSSSWAIWTRPRRCSASAAMLEALASAGLDVDPDLIVPAHFEVESAEASVDSLIRRGAGFRRHRLRLRPDRAGGRAGPAARRQVGCPAMSRSSVSTMCPSAATAARPCRPSPRTR